MDTAEGKSRYFIDLQWFEQARRSFAMLARSRLCPSCRDQHSAVTADSELLATFRDCCSKQEGFLNADLPLHELIFRLLLSSGNEPLQLQEMATRLKELLLEAGNTRDISLPRLRRIIAVDQFSGLCPFPEEAKET